MTLKEKLDATREASAKRIPAAAQAIMKRQTDDVRRSGLLSNVTMVGQRAPSFRGTAHDGRSVSLDDMTGRGAVVVSVFRGHW